jgi:PIN domain nuclease of toxin-antitoxin system
MNLLLDTHALLWFVGGDERMSPIGRAAVEDDETVCYISIASWWEIAIKGSLGKLTLADPLERFMENRTQEGFRTLPIEVYHLLDVVDMPFYHRDPFDRLIISQARKEDMSVCTGDPSFSAYSIPVIW